MRRIWILFLLVCLNMPLTFSQITIDPYYMTGYSYTENFFEIGTLLRNDRQPFKIRKIGGDAAKYLFTEGNTIMIKERYADRLFERNHWTMLLELQSGTTRETIPFRIVRDEFIPSPVVAHRGYWHDSLPHNSIASLNAAIELGCAASEFDVRMTADGEMVVHHDKDFKGLIIADAPLERVREIRLSNGETLPTLREYLDAAIQQNHTRLVLEIKCESTDPNYCDNVARKVLSEVKSIDAQQWVIYITFNIEVMKALLRYEPAAPIAYLNGDLSPTQLKHLGCRMLNYNQGVLRAHPEWFEEARSVGVSMNVWTVNDKQDMIFFLDRDVDRITTDRPDLLKEVVEMYGNR